MSTGLRFGAHLRELRIHLCQTSEASQGVREFIKKKYVALKIDNPKFPILIRECSGVQPRLWARYDMGKECTVSLANCAPDDVMKQIENMSHK